MFLRYYLKRTVVKIMTLFFVLLVFSLAVKSSFDNDDYNPSYYEKKPLQDEKQKEPETLTVLTQSQITNAINEYNSGNYNSIETLQKAVNQFENAQCAFLLGHAYRYGKGVSKDLSTAIHFYKLSAKQKYGPAYNTLGVIFRDNLGDKKTCFDYFVKGAECEDIYALYNVGACYENAWGTSKNNKAAISYYKKVINSCTQNLYTISTSEANSLKEESIEKILYLIEQDGRYFSYVQLSNDLTDGIISQYEQAHLIFRFIANSVEYDLSYSITTAEECFALRKGVCCASARLFKSMCVAEGIDCRYQEGRVYNLQLKYWYSNRHAWNTLYIDGRIIYCDVCWSSGTTIVGDDKWYQIYNPYYWDTPESLFELDHFPD